MNPESWKCTNNGNRYSKNLLNAFPCVLSAYYYWGLSVSFSPKILRLIHEQGIKHCRHATKIMAFSICFLFFSLSRICTRYCIYKKMKKRIDPWRCSKIKTKYRLFWIDPLFIHLYLIKVFFLFLWIPDLPVNCVKTCYEFYIFQFIHVWCFLV